jgi:peptide/nickel transport system substrate-binding protein
MDTRDISMIKIPVRTRGPPCLNRAYEDESIIRGDRFMNRIFFIASVVFLMVTAGLWAGGQQPGEPRGAGTIEKEGRYGEAPALASLVASGALPPVNERLPVEPGLTEVQQEIGEYGGTLQVFALNKNPWNTMTEGPPRGHYLLQLMKDGSIEGDVCKDWEMSDDATSFTLYYREGMKWSDGEPFTAQDFLFTYEDMHWDDKVTTWHNMPEITKITAVDDYTIRFETDEPTFSIPIRFAQAPGGTWQSFHPKHYLKKWHIKYNDKANDLAKEEGYDNWWEAMYSHYWWNPLNDLNLPTIQPWVMTESTTIRRVYERNPFYWKVDPENNQLPYIDRIVSEIVDPEVYQIKMTAGEADLAYLGTSLANYTLYKENEGSGDYKVVTLPNVVNGGEVAFGINQNDPDPVMRKLNEDFRYRKALSLAINRQEINDVVYFGLGTPRQCTVTDDAMYFKQEWADAYAQYEPTEANRLLDEVGLDKRDADGFRIRPDGKPLQLLVEFANKNYTPVLELVKEYWADVGLNVLIKMEESAFFESRYNITDHGIMCAGCYAAGEIGNYTWRAEFWRPAGTEFSWAIDWELWLDANEQIEGGRKTLADYGGAMPGEEPPDDIKQVMVWIKERGQVPFGSREYIETSQKIYDLHQEKLYVIGTVGLIPWVAIVKNRVGNFINTLGGGYYHALHISWFGDQFFIKSE